MLGLYYEMTIEVTSNGDLNKEDDSIIDPLLLKRRSAVLKPLTDSNNKLRRFINEFVDLQKEHESLITGAPITWARLSSGYRIIEFQVDRLQEAIDLLRAYFFNTDPIKVPNLYIGCDTAKKYQRFICNVVSNGNSFCAIEEGTGKLIGILLASILSDASDILDDSCEGEESSDLTTADLFNVLKLEKALLLKANVTENCNIGVYNCIHCVCVKPKFYGIGIGTSLVQACLSKLQKGDTPLCVGIFPSGASQTIALRLGFEKLSELPWINLKKIRKNVYRPNCKNDTVLEKSYVTCMYMCVHLDIDDGEEEEGKISDTIDTI